MSSTKHLEARLWAFVRRADSAWELQQYARSRGGAAELSERLGPELSTSIRDLDDRNHEAVYELRLRIWRFLEPGDRIGCLCGDWPDRRILPLSSATIDLLESDFARERDRNDWLHLVSCRGCGTRWYAAVDTVDDDYYLRRLSEAEVKAITERDEWPTDFDQFVNVWPAPVEPHRARLEFPWSDIARP